MQAKIWNYSEWIAETNPEELRRKFDKTLKASGFNILCFTDHHFDPQGYTALWLLTESHFAVHTFPEFGKTYIELSSCNPDMYMAFIALTKNM
ncbi:S-adenosylmethionine decarboxylase family protein [Alistipes putredinis]|uniref:S-adenosylmethionine decarboxylase family protein n=1 Tax=Alistipes putredinis TaxID=28117 RepID=UPI00396724AC